MMNEISNILLIITVFLSILFGIVLIVKSNSKKPTLLLGLFLIVYSANEVIFIVKQFFSESFFFQFLYFPFFSTHFLFVPLLYLYTKNLVSPISLKQEKIHLIPGVVDFLFFSILFFSPIATKKWLYSSLVGTNIYWSFYIYINFMYSLFYVVKIIKIINQYQLEVQNFYSTLEGKLLTWVKQIAFFLGFTGFIWISISLSKKVLANSNNFVLVISYTFLLMAVVNLFFICYTALMGLKQISLLEFSQMKLEKLQLNTPPQTLENTDKKEINQFYNKISEYITTEEPFTDPNLTLLSLSSELNVRPRRLSKVIKLKTSYNFNQFINKFRVEKAKELLIAPEYAHFSILGIAEEAGFNSKATFNTSFKQFTEMTPSEFKNQF